MTRLEEKLYLQSVFNAIDEVYHLKTEQKFSDYEQRLRNSLNKLLIPDWFNHDYTSANGLRKTKSHGQVPRIKRYDHSHQTSNGSISSSINSQNLSTDTTHRYRSSSQSWSEKVPLRQNSTVSSYDTNANIIINNRRSINSNGTSTYAPGMQRVAQSSTWYKPKIFPIQTIKNHSIEPPKPLPRSFKNESKCSNSTDSVSSLLLSKLHQTSPISNGNIRHPIKPRTLLSQIPVPPNQIDPFLDADINTIEKLLLSRTIEISSLKTTHLPFASKINSMSSSSSSSTNNNATSQNEAIVDKNLLNTDSSSYTSVNDQSLSSVSSSLSYHTARAGDTSSSSMTGYETPTPQLDDGTLSSHSSLSDLSHADTLEPNVEDLDITVVSTEEQKAAIIPLVDVGMENFPLPPISTASSFNESSPSNESRPIDSSNWYDDGSIATCIDQTLPKVSSNEKLLIEINDDEPSSSLSDDKQEFSENSISATNRLYSMENENLQDEITLTDEFHCSSTVDPFGFNHNKNNSSLMITNLDDILIDDEMDDDPPDKTSSKYLLNTNYRRPIQEDILYEVEHENSYSDHSQNTSSVILPDDNTSNKIDPILDFLTSTEEPTKEDIHQSTTTDFKSSETLSSTKQKPNDPPILPIYILPPLHTFTEKSSTLQIDTDTKSSMPTWNTSFHQTSYLSNLTSPSSSYTSKIRHRHFSVGSYYDNKTTTVAIHPNHTLYIIGSAPVSPISRTSTTSSETHYLHHHSPVSYGNTSLNALRRINPFLETNTFVPSYEYPRSTSLNYDERYNIIPSPSSFPSPPNSGHSQPPNEVVTEKTVSPPLPPLEREAPLVRPKTSRGRARTPPPSPPPRAVPQEVEPTQNVYQEIDNQSTDDDQLSTSRNDDLQFIRGTIERVFDFHGESASESTTNYEVISEEIKDDDESVSLSESSKTASKKNMTAYPAVEAVQRFYETKSPSESEEKKKEPTTNLDDAPHSNNKSSASSELYSRSHRANQQKKELSKSQSKSLENEQATSEEIDDTLNDIEDEDYQDEKLRRQATITSSPTSNENSPLHSFNNQDGKKKTSQETQTTGRQKPILITMQSPSGSQNTVHSYETAHSSIPPLDIVTQMVIERTDGHDDGRITEISGDMIIFYDDIEIVEHSSEISSTESETSSSISKSLKNSKSIPIIHESQQQQQQPPPPPPIPARTLKPHHLINNQQQQQQQQQKSSPNLPSSSTKMNRTYELEKATIRKKFDVNSVNDMLNRTDYIIGPTVTHRHPSARHFAGKLNSEDSSRTSSIAAPSTTIPKPISTTMAKSKTLPPLEQPKLTNGHSTTNIPTTPIKNSSSTLPNRSSSTGGANGKNRSTIADTNALVKQIQSSLSRNSLHDSDLNHTLSVSTKDLRTFVSSTYSPSDENMIDDDGIIHVRQEKSNNFDEQAFKRQARLSKSFHNVSEYSSSISQYPTKNDNNFPSRTLPSKSVENNLNHVSRNPIRNSQIPSNFPPVIASTSFSSLPQEDNARLLSMKWYTGQVSENSEICYNTPHKDNDDLLYAYISTHSNRDIQLILSRLQSSNDIRIHAALDDIRLRVAQFDALKSPEDLHIFMRYLESRLRDISNKNASLSSATTSSNLNGQRRISNGYYKQQSDTISIKSRTSSVATGLEKDTPPLRQTGRQHLRSSGNLAAGGGGGTTTNGNHSGPPPPPRRASQSSVNQENPQVFDEMLNTVLGLPKKGASTLPPNYPPPNSLQSRDKIAPLAQTQMTSNATVVNKNGRDVGKRLFGSGTFKDPRLIYDGSRKNEKEEQPLETSV